MLVAALLVTATKVPVSLTLTVPADPLKSVYPVITVVLIVPAPPKVALPVIFPAYVPVPTVTLPVVFVVSWPAPTAALLVKPPAAVATTSALFMVRVVALDAPTITTFPALLRFKAAIPVTGPSVPAPKTLTMPLTSATCYCR
ncbi:MULTISPECIES: hypothetical protein [spotted fever group]|uniref:Uncharacterized protein n=1 Tax=Rickettsia rhipicephali str. Ect TaxID=1359199 RepID=A0A0F3PEE0_RICRH|nr:MULTISPECIES: hypothetical protein [spotted fever group]KJV78653.1 hypothetical protein RMAECT_0881 [Rickettsia rhipicephali str. Ect]